jgi:hypothetical protein
MSVVRFSAKFFVKRKCFWKQFSVIFVKGLARDKTVAAVFQNLQKVQTFLHRLPSVKNEPWGFTWYSWLQKNRELSE